MAGATGDTGAGGGAGAGDGVGTSTDRPAAWTAHAEDYVPALEALSQKIEEQATQAYQAAALEEVRAEEGLTGYFDALEQHPRTLVGEEVPAIGREGMDRLENTQDAADWQDAVKQLLVQEVQDRAERAMEENDGFLSTMHSSIELFQNNTDLIPGTVEFDVDLANRFAELATPYELRVEDKLQGYSVPVQPLIDHLRKELVSERARTASTPASPASGAPAPATGRGASPVAAPAAPRKAADPPQASIPSKAGNSDQKEDFSTLFGTIGLPDLQI